MFSITCCGLNRLNKPRPMDKAAKSTESLGKTVQDKMGGIGKAMTYAGAATTATKIPAACSGDLRLLPQIFIDC